MQNDFSTDYTDCTDSNLKAAVEKLHAVMNGIVLMAEEKNKTRCPYKSGQLLCTFSGGCRNQLREGPVAGCRGDQFVFQSVKSV